MIAGYLFHCVIMAEVASYHHSWHDRIHNACLPWLPSPKDHRVAPSLDSTSEWEDPQATWPTLFKSFTIHGIFLYEIQVKDYIKKYNTKLADVDCGTTGSIDCTQTSQLGKLTEGPRTQTTSGAAQEGNTALRAAILIIKQNTKRQEISQ